MRTVDLGALALLALLQLTACAEQTTIIHRNVDLAALPQKLDGRSVTVQLTAEVTPLPASTPSTASPNAQARTAIPQATRDRLLLESFTIEDSDAKKIVFVTDRGERAAVPAARFPLSRPSTTAGGLESVH